MKFAPPQPLSPLFAPLAGAGQLALDHVADQLDDRGVARHRTVPCS